MSHNLNSEQNNKLRSMVKSKLMEIGEYVDDQLTDYVMIMITNKKTEKQMADDLELFLGGKDKSTAFSSWLHNSIANLINGTLDHQFRKSSSSSGKSTSHKVPSKSMPNIETDELAIQIENDEEFNDDFNDEKSNKTILKKKEEQNSLIETIESERSSSRHQQQLSNTNGQKVISSCVGAVINRDHRDSLSSKKNRDEKIEEDFEFSDSKSSRRLSSVVRISERKYSVPKEMQPNKNILFKAVNEANDSVNNKPKKSYQRYDESTDDNSSPRIIKTKNSDNKLELFSQHYHQNKKNEENVKRLRTSLTQKTSHYDQDETMNETDSVNIDTRRVQIDLDRTSALKQVDTNKREILVEQPNENAEPKFIVTLNGINEEKFLNKKRSYSDMQNENDDYEMADQQEQDDQEDMDDEGLIASKKKLIRCSFWPMCDKGDSCPYLHPNKPCTAFPNCQFGQQCHYLHPSCRYDGHCSRLDCPYTHVIKKPSLTVPPAHIKQDVSLTIPASASISSTEQANGSLSNPAPNSSSNVGPKITINKIQPLYSLVNNSPTQPVRTVPHSSSFHKPSQIIFPPNQYSLINRPVASNIVQVNCKYGNLCKNPKCIYTHPNLPQKSQLKWSATSINNQSSVAAAATKDSDQLNPNDQKQISMDNHNNNNNTNNNQMIMSN